MMVKKEHSPDQDPLCIWRFMTRNPSIANSGFHPPLVDLKPVSLSDKNRRLGKSEKMRCKKNMTLTRKKKYKIIFDLPISPAMLKIPLRGDIGRGKVGKRYLFSVTCSTTKVLAVVGAVNGHNIYIYIYIYIYI